MKTYVVTTPTLDTFKVGEHALRQLVRIGRHISQLYLLINEGSRPNRVPPFHHHQPHPGSTSKQANLLLRGVGLADPSTTGGLHQKVSDNPPPFLANGPTRRYGCPRPASVQSKMSSPTNSLCWAIWRSCSQPSTSFQPLPQPQPGTTYYTSRL